MDLCLGTVQFGMDYGIKGQRKPDLKSCIEMLMYATDHGIDTIDTANAYGDAETVVGCFLKKRKSIRQEIKIISKVKPNLLDSIREDYYYHAIKKNFEQTASRLGVDYLDGYLFHSSHYVFTDAMLQAMMRIKKEGYTHKVGVSVYEPEEARAGTLSPYVDIIQLPFSLLDQRMKKEGIFDLAKAAKKELHSRSAFVQGLLLMGEDEIPDFLQRAKPYIRKVDTICKEYKLNRMQLALQYVKYHTAIERLVFGVDNLEQLISYITYFNSDFSVKNLSEIEGEFSDIPAEIMMPSLWNRN